MALRPNPGLYRYRVPVLPYEIRMGPRVIDANSGWFAYKRYCVEAREGFVDVTEGFADVDPKKWGQSQWS